MANSKTDEIEKAIVSTYGFFPNISNVTEFLSMSNRATVKRFMRGVPLYSTGKCKRYFARDVANRIAETMETT